MKTALEWLNEVGETVANDCFSPDSGAPGRNSELLIERIQADARKELLAELAKFREAMEREKSPKWIEYVKRLADVLESASNYPDASPKFVSRQDLKSASILLNEHWQCFTHKANFVPSELKIKALEAEVDRLKGGDV